MWVRSFDVHFGEDTVQPDLFFVSHEQKDIVKSDGVHGAPDVIFEIISDRKSVV